ncbi:MAG: DUF2306 domain-containing protein [Caulobacteraceae bacterium]|jgi:hypothetical protein
MSKRLNRTLWWLTAISSVGLALFSYRYLPRLGPLAPNVMGNAFANPWLDLHVAGAATALITVPFQLLAGVRRRWPQAHRWTGRVYVVGCLTGGVGGLVMAFGSTSGPVATAGFGSLAVIWIIANIQGWRAAVARRFGEHRAWMIRSFAMTFGAVTLRIYLPLLPLLGLSFMDSFRVTSFLAWVPNLILAELYLRGAFDRPRTSATAPA